VITKAIDDDYEEENWSDISAFLNQILVLEHFNINGIEEEKYNFKLNIMPRDCYLHLKSQNTHKIMHLIMAWPLLLNSAKTIN